MRLGIVCAAVWVALGTPRPGHPQQSARDREGIEFFEKKIRPILVERCYSCHSHQARKVKSGFYLDSREGLLKGGYQGPALLPGNLQGSRLIRAVRYTDLELQMPPQGKLPARLIKELESWVRRGAPDPRTGKAVEKKEGTDFEIRRRHWAYHAPKEHPLPTVKGVKWVRNGIDRFVLARLEERGMSPAPEADKRTLIRRLTLDLTGLPPTPAEVDAFLADRSPEATAKLVDRLLDSPSYGERWGRHWLDVARYSDTKGYAFQEERRFPYSYTYRDWVIRALNEDMPYDRFLVYQIAADRVVKGDDRRHLAAMGFLTLGRRFLNRDPDIIDDRIDVVMRGTMAVTMSCARCHDHKFDPLRTSEYYGLYGIFASSEEPKDLPTLGPARDETARKAYEQEHAKLKADEQKYLRKKHAELTPPLFRKENLAKYLLAAQKVFVTAGRNLREVSREVQLRSGIVERWAHFLKVTRDHRHPAFVTWHAYAKLSPGEFAAKAGGVKARGPVNPIVAKAFATAPGSLQEVAGRYAELLAKHDRKEKFAEPPKEMLRQILRGPNAPPNVPVAEAEALFNRADRNGIRGIRKKIARLRATHAGAPEGAQVLVDRKNPADAPILLRGNSKAPGPVVPRKFPEAIAAPGAAPFRDGSGRLELARAIANPANPLTARVLVNRVWRHHFGAGMVTTPSDFGLRSDPPSHPKLLDWLAVRFVKDGGSIKTLHRRILQSATYRQSSASNPKHASADPDNRLLWRQNRRRLEFEAMRDSLLAVSGLLDRKRGGKAVPLRSNPTARSRMDAETIRNVAAGDPSKTRYSRRRSIYLFIDRQNLQSTFRSFDFASPDTHAPKRFETTVPQQALFLMNNPFVVEQALGLVNRKEIASEKDPAKRIRALYGIVFGRPATRGEIDLGRAFIAAEEKGGDAPVVGAGDWKYGYGTFDSKAGRVRDFLPLPHFTGTAWQGGPKLPDPKLGWLILSATGGHPDPAHGSAIRRWTAPRTGAVSIEGVLEHAEKPGNGVRARIVSSRLGVLASWSAHHTRAGTKMSRVEVRKGDTIDFVVDSRGDVGWDSFSWAPVVRMKTPPAATAANQPIVWDARADFLSQPAPRKALTPWEKYAQVLLLSNEFMFVD